MCVHCSTARSWYSHSLWAVVKTGTVFGFQQVKKAVECLEQQPHGGELVSNCLNNAKE